MFVQTLARDWLTEAVMEEMGINERQTKAVFSVRQHGQITDREYQELTGTMAENSSSSQ